jgi:hypothetical protein
MYLRNTCSLYEKFSEAHCIYFLSGWGSRDVIGCRIATERQTATQSDVLRLGTKVDVHSQQTTCPTIDANYEVTTSAISHGILIRNIRST